MNTINNSVNNFNNIMNVYNLNKKLTSEYDNYSKLENDLIILKMKNSEYKNLLNISDDIKYNFVTSKIISRSNLSYTKSVILASGKNDNITLGSPVIYQNSLLGFIRELGNTSSRLISITDGTVKIPSIILEKKLNIIVSGNNDKYLEILNLNNFPNIKDGDKVFTSGDGNKFPENLFIGTIKTKKNGDFIVEPSLDINRLNYVYILNWSLKDRGIDIKVDPIFYD